MLPSAVVTASAPSKSNFRGSMTGLRAPLSTLRCSPYDVPRMTRGQRGSPLVHCAGLSPATLCRSPGARQYYFATVKSNVVVERSPGSLVTAGCHGEPVTSLIPLTSIHQGLSAIHERIAQNAPNSFRVMVGQMSFQNRLVGCAADPLIQTVIIQKIHHLS